MSATSLNYRPFTIAYASHQDYQSTVDFNLTRWQIWKGRMMSGGKFSVVQHYSLKWKRCECCELPIIEPEKDGLCTECLYMFEGLQ